MKKLHLVSLGCTKNLVDSEVMLGKLKEYQLTDNESEADVIIINTCGFIEASKKESLNRVFDLHSNRKSGSILVMAGCLSERYRDELANELKEVDIFTGVGDYAKIDELINSRVSKFSDSVYLIKDEERVVTNSNYHAYIKIAEGCNQSCSFCAIPQFKGKLQSRELKHIVDEVKRLVSKGFIDFSFISQDSSSYLRDKNIKDGLINLIEEIEKIDGIKSARILYLYPSTTSKALIERIGKSKIFHNYFDIPIQHISDSMLKVMKRGFDKEKTIEILNAMRDLPNSFVRTTLIIGHPKESQEDINELIDFLKEYKFDRVNVFEYSDEEGTLAYTIKDKIPKKEITNRIKAIKKVIDKNLKESLKSKIGLEVLAFLDGDSSEHSFLKSVREWNFAPEIDGEILINDSEIESLEIGKLYKVKIVELKGDKLIGKILSLATN